MNKKISLENEKHSSGCNQSCNGTYYFGGNYNTDGSLGFQPYNTECWCWCHKK